MKTKMRIKGRLRTYLRFTIYLGILLLVIDIAAFTINRTAGWLLAVFTVVYIAVTLILYFYNKPLIMNELVSFATEYGQIQRKLLRELNIPYALLDEDGKVMWTNRAFEHTVHQTKGYSKNISSLFPVITPDRLPIAEGVVIQEADIRALASGTTTDKIFKMVKELREETDMPLVFMGYLNPVFYYGYERFFARCEEVGISGVIIPDLPFEEKDCIKRF